jgi:hypothetical protein
MRTKKLKAPKVVRIKKVKLTSLQKKCEKIKTKMLGKTGAFGILSKNDRYYFILRYVPRGSKREKILNLYSCPDLKLIQEIGLALSLELEYPYNSIPKEKKARQKTVFAGYEIDHSIFKVYKDQPFIFLSFGSIFLKKESFEEKRNWEKVDNKSISELYNSSKFQAGYTKCQEILEGYSKEKMTELMKAIGHYGCLDDKNSVRLMLTQVPIETYFDEERNVVVNRELVLENN